MPGRVEIASPARSKSLSPGLTLEGCFRQHQAIPVNVLLERYAVMFLIRFVCRSAIVAGLVFGAEPSLTQGVIPPAQQREPNWVDGRVNDIVRGRHQASVVALDSGTVLKGLSIALGDQRQRTICFDTKTGVARALWEGDLVEYNGRRFGVVDSPNPTGPSLSLAPSQRADAMESVRWYGVSVQGTRVVLRYEVGGRLVKELPGWHSVGEAGFLTRDFVVGPGKKKIAIPILDLESRELSRGTGPVTGEQVHTVNDEDFGSIAIGILGPSGRLLVERKENRPRNLVLEVGPSSGIQRMRLGLSYGNSGDESFTRRLSELPGTQVEDYEVPGDKLWERLETKGITSRKNEAYTIDTLTVPDENPWNALMFLSGVDFLPNGDAAVCTMHGDVWLVKGIDSNLNRLEWHRFATGLNQPLGLQVVNGVVHVLGRDQVTALEDLNDDGFADVYRNHSNLIQTQNGHRFVTSLQANAAGELFYVDPLGVHRIAADGSEIETIATGWRNPNGMGLSPDGVLTVAPQQGGWTPSSQISEVRAGGFYGAGGPQVSSQRPLGYDPPLCWIPHAIDNSGGSQVWTHPTDFGPLSGRPIHLSYGRCSMMLMLRDRVGGQPQGGVVPLPGKFLSGVMRGAVHPIDHQLYLVGATGWQTSALRDGCFQRVRYTGKAACLPVDLAVYDDGIEITFSEPLDRELAGDVESWGLQQWNYRYAKDYGSKDYSVANPDQEGRDELQVESVGVSEGGQQVFLKIPEIRPVMQMEIRYNLDSSAGDRVRGRIYQTIHRLRSR